MLIYKTLSFLEGKTGDKNLSKAVNRAILIELIKVNSSISRASLSKQSGLTKTTVSSQITDLIELDIVSETGAGESDLGRKPVMLELNGKCGYALGISITTNQLHIVVADMSGNVICDELEPITENNPVNVIEQLKKCIRKITRRNSKSRYGLIGVGLAVPGAMEIETGHLIRSAKLDWCDVSIVKQIAQSFKGYIHAGNDATLATIAEHELYASNEDDFICLLIDEGIGLGAFINGNIHYGYNGQFGEVGHMTIVQDGEICPCGNRGCWDLYGSELALRQMLAAISNKDIIDEDETIAIASSGDEFYTEVFNVWIEYLATGLINIINSLAPSAIIINNRILSISDKLFLKLKEKVAGRAMAHLPVCELRLSKLGKSAMARGAGMAVQGHFFNELILTGA